MVSHDQATSRLQRGDYAAPGRSSTRASPRARELGTTSLSAGVLLDVGILELRERRYAEARAFAESLERALGAASACTSRCRCGASPRAAAGRGGSS